ncbi:MAG: tellurite resistance TerB family protein [Candidatus Caenarcaniphilales bacterium]|nr:tellurite resistance TerB family protein [Candidatus Caenarcaniphilales bacterium]
MSQVPIQFDLTIPESVFAILLVAARADLQVQSEEKLIVSQAIARLKIFEGEDIKVLSTKVVNLLNENDPDLVLESAALQLDNKQSATVYAIACDLLSVEGAIEEQELVFLEKLQNLLKLNDSVAKQIIQVTVIKNRQL